MDSSALATIEQNILRHILDVYFKQPKQAVVLAEKPTKFIEVGVSSECPMASHTFQDKIFKSAPESMRALTSTSIF